MKLHGNARLTPKGRLIMCRRVVDEGWSLATAAEAAGVSERTAWKWVGRYRAEGEAGLVAVSGYGQPVDQARSEEAGFDLHLLKPLSRESLARALAAIEQRP